MNRIGKLFVGILSGILLGILLITPAFAAPVGTAQLKGTYTFGFSGVKTAFGYYSGSVWHLVNGQCPKTVQCSNQAFQTTTIGTVSFSGTGKATFLSIATYDPSGQPNTGGPVKGTVWPYTVSGVNGYLGTKGNGATMTLGAYNASGLASVVIILTADTTPKLGIATLQ